MTEEKFEIGTRRRKIWDEKEEKILFFKARYYKRLQNTFYKSSQENLRFPKNTNLFFFQNKFNWSLLNKESFIIEMFSFI